MEANWLGQVEYRQALELQMQCIGRRAAGEIPDILLLLTHPHVYTIGRIGDDANLLVPPDLLAREGIPLARISRGGDITYHGPGQLVGYPIVLLSRPDVHRFVRSIEAALIEALSQFGVSGARIEGLTGVWTMGKKIASIGIGVRRWVTYHGFALNVDTDLSYFRRIHLCGLKGREATSIAEATGRKVPMEAVCDAVTLACGNHLRGFS
ncbi:MAG: lipoyl(octanoyl) transferase [Deltaproteobacteria bacterium RBG_16_64_85]|nr:MAG: lipoyl(octanoyl) transferase [Deltaproteobacteria bacterium RBG_16_64_85]